MTSRATWAIVFIACGGSGGDRADAGGSDAGRFDAAGLDAGADAGPLGSCGDAQPDIADLRATEGMVIARDGTIYYSQAGSVGRLPPGGVPDPDFVPFVGERVSGLALDASNDHLFVALPGAGVRTVDLTGSRPSVTTLVAGAEPSGMTFGADGYLYFADTGDGLVHRVAPGGGSPDEVTTVAISDPRAIVFDEEGALLVASYGDGTITRVTLSSGVEIARELAAESLGAPHGLAVGADGAIYVTNSLGTNVVRIEGGARTTAATGIAVPAHLAFGTGALRCGDLYVTSQRELARVEDVGPGLAVPWQ